MKFLFFLVPIFIWGCNNQYENKIIGDYAPKKIIPDSVIDNSIYLKLKGNRSYELHAYGKKHDGTWNAGDNGDRTWIEFNDSVNSQGQILGREFNVIRILNPGTFCCPGVDSLYFERVL